VTDAVPECRHRLAREGPPREVRDGAADDERQAEAELVPERLEREDGGLGVECVEDGLDQEQVSAAIDQPAGIFIVAFDQFIERDFALAGVVDVGADAGRDVGRSQ